MQNIKIAIGADHRGFGHKEYIKNRLVDIDWIDVGASDTTRSDYPVFAHKVSEMVVNKVVDYGVLICGSGIGMAITANRYKEVYAGLVWNEKVACESKEDDNVNIIALPSDYISEQEAVAIVTSWLSCTFKGGRYQKRIDMI